jgi:hypothetical protein
VCNLADVEVALEGFEGEVEARVGWPEDKAGDARPTLCVSIAEEGVRR